MDPFFKMDVFFVVATAATAVFALLFAVILVYVIRILRTVDRLSNMATEEAELLRADIQDMREYVRDEGFKAFGIGERIRKTVQRIFRRGR